MTLIKWEVHSMIGSCIFSNVIDMSSPWEIVLKFVKGTGHNAISEIKCLLYSISVVNIYVNVEDPLKSFEQLKNSKDTIVYITKP
jgi:hypothetical protein